MLDSYLKPYRERQRLRFEGPRNLDKSLKLSHDFYAYTYLHQFKRMVIFNDGDVSTDEEDKEEEETDDF